MGSPPPNRSRSGVEGEPNKVILWHTRNLIEASEPRPINLLVISVRRNVSKLNPAITCKGLLMIVHAQRSEGDMFAGYEVRALDLCECYKTGILKTLYAGELKVTAVVVDGSCIIHDFILQALGHCPTRFRSNPYANKCMWAY